MIIFIFFSTDDFKLDFLFDFTYIIRIDWLAPKGMDRGWSHMSNLKVCVHLYIATYVCCVLCVCVCVCVLCV